ncbi:hypothetical protein C9890_0636, partial [Perkinsus sp. BL_2016]
TLTSCSASSTTSGGGSSNGANAYGGGISLQVGAYSYGADGSGSSVSGSTTVSSTNYSISGNTLTSCSASSTTSGGGSSLGANAYGGGISLQVGAYSYGINSGSSVSGSTTVVAANYNISGNTLTSCSASSTTSGGGNSNSNGANAYGGGISLQVGAYSNGNGVSGGSVSGSTTVVTVRVHVHSVHISRCSAVSFTGGASNGAFVYGGAVALIFESYTFPSTSFNASSVIVVSSSFLVNQSVFSDCTSSTSSVTCAAASSSAAGGSIFASMPTALVGILSTSFFNTSAVVNCAASSLSSYSLGGGVSIFNAGDVSVASSSFSNCYAQGLRQSNNVFVSGGGVHVQAAESLVVHNCTIVRCSLSNAFSSFSQSGGSALGAQNVSSIRILGSSFFNNSDSSQTGTVLLQQGQPGVSMNVSIDSSSMFLLPSDGPALNVNCSIPACTLQQQRLISIQFNSSNITIAKGSSSSDRQIFVIPAGAIVSSAGSFASCSSSGNSPVAVFSVNDSYSTYVACRPCADVFHIALTSQLFDIGNLQPIQNTDCLNLAFSNVSQSCPFGTALCTTSLSVTTGFWTNFTETNAAPYYRLNVVVLCPSGYCGCDSDSCLLAPPFSPDYRPDDALCTGNRMGVLCGGCKRGFTQSLDGVTCFSNDECAKNVGWTWAVTVIGYSLYAAYIVVFSAVKRFRIDFSSISGIIMACAHHSVRVRRISVLSNLLRHGYGRIRCHCHAAEWTCNRACDISDNYPCVEAGAAFHAATRRQSFNRCHAFDC